MAGMSGRPKTYEEAAVLDAAMNTFWVQGYESTSYSDLVTATGLGRQSLYHAFGDKLSLYRKALSHYSKCVTQQSLDILVSGGSPLGNIHSWLMRLRNRSVAHRNGCLLTNTAVEMAPRDRGIQKLVTIELGRIEKTLRLVLQRAVDLGELAPNTNVSRLATFLLGTAQGLMVLGRCGASSIKLKAFTDTALATVDASKQSTNIG